MSTVGDLGEDALIASFVPLLPRGRETLVPTGDDATVVAVPGGRVVVSTDVLVEGHHFRRDWGTAADVGWRAAVQNLADVAAMGAQPLTLVVALVLPPTTPVDWVHGLARGLAEACAPLGVGVDGGDLSAGEELVVAVTVHGALGAGTEPVLRSGARPGDVVAHCGVLGLGAGGYAALAAGRGPGGAGPTAGDRPGTATEGGAVADALAHFLRPQPPLHAGPAAAHAGATAMMDVSDGLLRDAGRLARASGIVVDLDEPADAVPDALARLAAVADGLGADASAARAWLLTGGEDHGMLATFPPDTPLPPDFTRLGVVSEPGVHAAGTVLVAGDVPALSPGWDHFRS